MFMVPDWSPLLISLKTAFSATVITFLLGLAVAHLMSKYKGKLKGLIDGIFLLPMVLPPTVLGFILLLLFGKNGPIGQLLLKLGTTIVFSWPATVIAATVVAFPLMYKTTLASFEQIDPNIIDAARTLGVSEWYIFWRVTVPLSWSGIAAATVLSFTRALGEFGATLMLAGNIPGRTQTIPIAIFNYVESDEMYKGLVWVVVIIAISLSMILSINYWSKRQRNYSNPFRGI